MSSLTVNFTTGSSTVKVHGSHGKISAASGAARGTSCGPEALEIGTSGADAMLFMFKVLCPRDLGAQLERSLPGGMDFPSEHGSHAGV